MPRARWTLEQAYRQALDFFGGDDLRAEVFVHRYALRDLEGRWLEATPEMLWQRLAQHLARPEKDRGRWQQRFFALLAEFRFVPGGRILFATGNPRRATLFNCYFIPIASDSVYGITRWMFEASKTYSAGGGVGTNIDVLRPRGARVRNAGLESSGSVSFMEVFSTLTGVMGISGGRRGALMITTRVDHPDILEFIRCKSDPARSRVRNANISVRVSDAFMHAVDADAPWHLRFTTPHETLVRQVPARQVWDALVEAAWLSAEPGLLFWDTIQRFSTTQYHGMEVQGVNVCGEVPMEPYGACNLGSLNLAAFVRQPFTPQADVDWEALETAVHDAVRFLDNVIDVGAPRHPLRLQRLESEKTRRIGLGVMGLADALVMLGHRYDGEAARRWVETCFAFLKRHAYAASIELAREKGSFPAFAAEAHLRQPFLHTLPAELQRAIRRYGLRNAALLSVAPTGSISILAGVSSGIEPIFALQYLRHVADKAYRVWHPLVQRYRAVHGEEAPLPETFVTAHQVDPLARVALQACAQAHVDQSISSTINLPEATPVATVARIFRAAWQQGCKGITVFREGSRSAIVEPLDAAATAFATEKASPVGVCTFCELPPAAPGKGA
ncbi:MAG: ribonucleoside-diphosphate reductase, adenosylcobalamin-dependent [Candidatus Tectimicrobiota bacterium]|nr:MAG: ribonucleoside-diphosphate reductase, adenosylcobalamin-dependent [Candidatus Tectomicrobia bacterium]